ncbi:MAG: sulfite exporter TauE/SafE family protein [Acidiferrobacterales bacterium]
METIASPYLIAFLFFLIALAYSAVGLGGGSSYTALMFILGFSTLVIPTVSLTLNLFVTSVGSFNFIRNKHAKLKLILPFLVASIPMAYLGGSLQLPKEVFYWILLASLLFVVARIYLWENMSLQLNLSERERLVVSIASGGVLGLIAGIAGIGGGIYLVPLIIILGLGTAKQAAACGVIFIWLNSASGLVARAQHNPINLSDYIPIVIAVLTGGLIGSYFGARKLSPKIMEKILGAIIIVAIGLLVRKLLISG